MISVWASVRRITKNYTKTWIIFFILLAPELVLAVLTFDKNEVMSSIAGNLSRLVLDGTIGIAIYEKIHGQGEKKSKKNKLI